MCLLCGAVLAPAQSAESKQQQIETHAQKAQEYLREKKPEQAIPELEALVALDPSNVDAQGNLGVLLFFKGRYAEAVPHLRVAVSGNPALTKIQGLLGIAEKNTGDPADARKDLEAAFPVLTDAQFRVQAGMELVELYTASGELEKAAGVLSQLRRSDPEDPEVLYATYRTYSDLAGEAMLALSMAHPDAAQMHQVMAHEDARQGNNDAAIAQYKQALAIDPKLPGADYELAQLLREAPDSTTRAEAAGIFEAALKANPFDEKSATYLGDIALEKGDLAAAKKYYEQALQVAPGDADANFGLAKTLIAMNQSAQALPILEKAVQLDPTNASAHFRLATLYRQQGRTADARQQLIDFKNLRDLKDKLSALYKQMRVQQPVEHGEDKDGK